MRGQARGAEVAKFLLDAVQRGLVEFYNRYPNPNPNPNPNSNPNPNPNPNPNRWNNVGDALGWSFLAAAEAVREPWP